MTNDNMTERHAREKGFWEDYFKTSGLRNDGQYVADETLGLIATLLGDVADKRILSIGGGVDDFAVWLAGQGAYVTSMDVSERAVERTNLLAQSLPAPEKMSAVAGNCEDMDYENAFDIVVSLKALHHMNIGSTVDAVKRALVKGGAFIAWEPVCLLSPVRFIHKTFPFHPDYPVTDDEKELSVEDINYVKQAFKRADVYYYDVLARASVRHFLRKFKIPQAILSLKQADRFLLSSFPSIKALSSEAVIRAVKQPS